MLVRLAKRYRRGGVDYLPGAVLWVPWRRAKRLIERGDAIPEPEPQLSERRSG